MLLPNFGLDTIRLCSMHNLNLGLVFIANGSSLCLGFGSPKSGCGFISSKFYQDLNPLYPRYTLAKAGWYGNPSDNLGKLFEAAYVDFKAWLREVKIYSSQRKFKYGLVACIRYGAWRRYILMSGYGFVFRAMGFFAFWLRNRYKVKFLLTIDTAEIMKKKDGGLRVPSMSCKAWNGRIVLEYLASVSRMAASKQPAAGARRCFGAWLAGQVRAGTANFSSDPKIPLQAVALRLDFNYSNHSFCQKK